MPTATVDGTRLWYLDEGPGAGAGTGPILLFVHGFPLNHAMWREQVEHFRSSHRVVVPDLRGFGLSQVTPGTVGMDRFASDLNGLLDAMQVDEPIVLCGLSMGGYIAFQFVEKHAARLGGLVLCDTRAAADTPDARTGRAQLAADVLANGPGPAVDAMLPRLCGPKTLAERPGILALLRETILGNAPAGIAAALGGMAGRPDMRPLLPTIAVPTLVLVGADDVISPPTEMRGMADAIPGAEFVTIAGAGHMAPMEDPAAVNAALARFLARLGPAR